MHPFQHIDHPLVLIGQALLVVGLFRYFFYVHRQANAVPASSAGLSFVILVNLYARVMHADWFWIIDAVQYGAMAVQVALVCFAKQAEKQAMPTPPKPDLFDNWQQRIVWTIGLIVLALVVFASVKAYQRSEKAEQEAMVAATNENTRVRQQYEQEQERANQVRDSLLAEADWKRDSILETVSSMAKVQKVVVSDLHSVSVAQKKLSTQVRTNAVRDTTVKTKPHEPAEIPTPKRNLWHRIFGRSVPADSSNTSVSADSLALY